MNLDLRNRALVGALFLFSALATLRGLRLHPDAHEELDYPGVVPSEINVLSLNTGGEYVRMARPAYARPGELETMTIKDHPWLVTFPTEARGPANVPRVEALLDAWSVPVHSDIKVLVDPTPEELATFGLQRLDTLHLHLERADDDELISVEIGMPAPGGGRYVRLEGIGPVFVAELPGLDAINPVPESWLRETAPEAVVAELEAFGVDGPEGFAFGRRDDWSWFTTRPAGQEVDPQWIEELAGRLLLVPGWPTLDLLTLEEIDPDLPIPNAVTAWLTRAGARTKIELGDLLEDQRFAYARIDGGPLRTGPRALATDLRRPVEEQRDRTLLRFQPSGEATLHLSAPGAAITLTRGPRGGWTQEGGPLLRPSEVAEVLWSLHRLLPASIPRGEGELSLGGDPWVLSLSWDGQQEQLRFSPTPDGNGLYLAESRIGPVLLEPDEVRLWMGLLEE